MASRAVRRRATYRALNNHRRYHSRPVLKILVIFLVLFTMITSGASAATIFFYGNNLPTLGNFKNHFQFQNTRFFDSSGHVLLYDMADLSKSKTGRRVVEPLMMPGHTTAYYKQNKEDWLVGEPPGSTPYTHCGNSCGVPPVLQNATISTEDATFYSNLGFDPLSIARAAVDDITTRHIVSGASTITQQLVRAYMLSPGQGQWSRKAEEIILSAELTQKYPKSQILYYYLNSVPYGNQTYGAQAAAKTYFHKNVWNLDLPEAALLAGLPEGPSLYDPVSNLPAAKERMRHVLHLMYIHGYLPNARSIGEQGEIDSIMNSKEVRNWKFSPPSTHMLFPHFVQYAVRELQNIKALQGRIYSGLDVITTIDPKLQDAAQQTVTGQIDTLGAYHVTDGALVSLDLRRGPHGCYGCIRAMVGSPNYNDVAISGKINMADSPRQPGSSFKPFNYVYAFEHGLGPATDVLDAPISIPDPGNPDDNGYYQPTNYDLTWHGVVPLRVALQNSLNIPAVKVEEYGATCSDACGGSVRNSIAQQAVRQGVTDLFTDNPHCCGWALTLGGLERGIRLVQETAAYGAFATPDGVTVPPISVWKVYDRSTHQLLYDASKDGPKPTQAFPAPTGGSPGAYGYEMTNVLSDDASRCAPQACEFGIHSDLYVGRPAGAKTGTTNAFTDNWTVGYTPQIVTGVWVGNADNSPMVGTTGITGAAPIWHDFMLKAFDILKLPPESFPQPSGVSFGSSCRLPGAYGTYSTFGSDIYVNEIPLCSVPDDGESSATTYQPPAVQQPTSQAPAVVAPTVPVATTPPAVVQPTVLPPTLPPVQAAPTQAPQVQQSVPTAVPQAPPAIIQPTP
jgi:membrane peptidoglycan carboxypeptidase